MFRAGLLHINRRCIYVYVDWLLAGSILPTAGQHKRMTYTNYCIYTVVPPDDEQ